MDAVGNAVHGFLGTLNAWLPGGGAGGIDSSSLNMSREFWMPDQSCKECYECGSQFTVFNRRHHCRVCGRVFCGKCTLNTIPASIGGGVLPDAAQEDGDRIRVCNFCFKLRQQQERGNPGQLNSSPTLTPSSSRSSLFSCNTSSMASPPSIQHSGARREDELEYKQLTNDFRDSFSFQEDGKEMLRISMRSDDEDEGRKEDESSLSHNIDHGDDHHHHEDYQYRTETDDRTERSSSRKSCDDIEGLEDETNFHGHLYEAKSVDFENNLSVWYPPPPEEDEDETGPGYDDDDEDDEGGWGLPRSSGSMSSSEYRNRERAASEEHRKAMRAVVDGHFKALVAQLLKGEDILVEDEEENEKDSWLEIVTELALEAARIVKPDSSRGGSMDPGGYVKVKCIASGRRSDSMVVKGIVCKKNLAHKRMTTRFKNPRLLILGGALEYHRIPNLLSSMDTLLQQEKEYLNRAAAKIEFHHPNVVIVEKGVSGFAQDRLLQKEISLVQNVKRPLLERIARCTGAQIIASPDDLGAPKTGHCEHFYTERFVEEHGSAGQGGRKLSKTLMFFEGCPKPYGCTALLRGANGDVLKKIKRVLQLSVFASYHLSLETSFLADEGASLPDHRSPIVVTLPSKQSSSDRSITSVAGFLIPGAGVPVSPHQAAPSNSGVEIRNSLAAAMTDGGHLRGFNLNGFTGDWPSSLSQGIGISGLSASLRRAFGEEALRSRMSDESSQMMWNYSAERSPNDNAAQTSFQQDEQTLDLDEQGGKDDFPPTPSDHQSILVSLSTRCLTKGSVCERPNIVRIKYYGNSDKPLGRFLRDTLFDLDNRCQHQDCNEPPDAHIRCYTHRLGSLTISVRRMKDHVLPGEREGKIWMWHRCLKCPREDGIPPVTRRIVMSDAAWCLSFGKFLELSFSNHAAASRVAVCGHQLHRDCLRFYGFGHMIACFRYASVHLHSVCLPPPKLEFNDPTMQEWLANEAKEVANKGEMVFAEILNTLLVIGEHIASSGSFSGSGRIAEVRKRAVQLEAMFKNDKAEFEAALLKAAPLHTEPGQPVADIFELTRLRKDLCVRAVEWEKRLHYFASSQQRKFSTSSTTGLVDASKESTLKTSLLKTYSNTEVGAISQPFSPGIAETDNEVERSGSATVKDDSVVPDGGCDVVEAVAADSEAVQEAVVSLDGDIMRTLSEGNCPVLSDLSHTLEAAWSGSEAQGQASDPEMQSAAASSPTEEEGVKNDCESGSTTGDVESRIEQPATDLKQCEEEEEEELSSPQQKDAEIDELGNWIDGPYSTLYRARKGWSTPTPTMCRAGQEAFDGGARLFMPGGVDGTVIAVYEDEPSSVIAHALMSHYYATQLGEKKKQQSAEKENGNTLVSEETSLHPLQSDEGKKAADAPMKERSSSFKDALVNGGKLPEDDVLLNEKGLNLKIENSETGPDAKLKYVVTAYYSKHFDALRKKCCSSDLEYVRSLTRCNRWGAQGGKSNVFFARTKDQRLIIKQVTRTEMVSFLEFAPEYFKYLFGSLKTGNPTCLAKILGMYQVIVKQAKGGKEILRMDLMVMENLMYGRGSPRIYDLKGSVRSRYNSDAKGKDAVLLDQNLLESMPTAPIFVGNKAKRLLERAVWNDTGFLATIDVMDYSLLVGIDEARGELVLGIIDYMRQYTWDKHLETWVKASGILGGPKNAPPTVISPKQYKKRFRKAMSTYFVTVPDHWTPPSVISAHPSTEESSSNTQEDYAESYS